MQGHPLLHHNYHTYMYVAIAGGNQNLQNLQNLQNPAGIPIGHFKRETLGRIWDLHSTYYRIYYVGYEGIRCYRGTR